MNNCTPTRKRHARKIVFRSALFLIPAGIIGNIVFSLSITNWDFFRAPLTSFSMRYLPLAVLLALLPWLFHSLRIRLWTDFIGHRFSPADALYVVLGDELGSSLTPTAIGGGYVKLGLLIEKGIKPGTAVSLSTIGTLENGVFFALSIPFLIFITSATRSPVFRAVTGNFVLPSPDPLVFCLIVLACIGTATMALLLWGKRALTQVTRAGRDFLHTYRLVITEGKKRFAVGIMLTALQWVCRYSVVTALVACFGITIHPLHFFLFQWIVFALTTVIPTPGGSVGAEASFYLIFQAFVPGDIMGLLTAVWRFLTYYLQMVLGAIFFIMLNTRKLTTGRS